MTRTYRGRRGPDGKVAVIVETGGSSWTLDPAPSQKVRNHSPDGFEWGYAGSGPAQLALAILLDVTLSSVLAERNYMRFKWEHVARWKQDSWEITDAQVMDWLAAILAGPVDVPLERA
jgi:hypothetical protein